ncbi:MAG: M28 family peptidase [Vicingus serpentipes]|nr:M28 family peptidase [Vicingus serpentipes]
MKKIITLFFVGSTLFCFGQTNILSTNPVAEQVMLGNYTPSAYASTVVIDDHDMIIQGINTDVNPDSLKSLIIQLASFQNRNTGSDTISAVIGIGAARKWVYSKFEEISTDNENRLITSYLQFDQEICGVVKHKNVFAVLPGTDVVDNKVIIIEGHMDSRCEDRCDSLCVAEGVDDNASGTALVIELARVMSKYTFKNTLVFMTTTGEEQGLLGANAFSQYALDKGIQIEAVFNNDVVGGIICGKTSSAPSCPGEGHIDSTQVRLFSANGNGAASKSKQLARYAKLEYKEELLPIVSVPMLLTIMTAEDRTGRGGDHIPFREDGFAAMRFCSANENGDAGSTAPGYTDRQHSSNDILGVDTDSNSVIDSFFVDFNYLARNAVINGNSAAMAAIGPATPGLSVQVLDGPAFEVTISSAVSYPAYRIAIRSTSNDWDSVYTTTSLKDTVYAPVASNIYRISVASVDSLDIESLFSDEVLKFPTGIDEFTNKIDSPFELLQNNPNPYDEVTMIGVKTNYQYNYQKAMIVVRDLQGRLVKEIPISLKGQYNEVAFEHGYGQAGIYIYSLVVDGKLLSTKQMVYAN